MSATVEQSRTDRAQAYVALLGMLAFEVHAPALGQCVETWALFMSGTDVSKAALIAGLMPVRERCPMVSLIRACAILDLDITDLIADDEVIA